jgi:hypothetical protein
VLLLEERLMALGEEVRRGNATWKEVADILNQEYGENLSRDAVRKRYYTRKRNASEGESGMNTEISGAGEYETRYDNGMVEAQKVVEYSKEIFGDKRKMLEYLGYNPDEWEFMFLTTSMWNQHTKEQTTKQLYAVKFKIKPITKVVSLETALEIAKDVFKSNIQPLKVEKSKKKSELDSDRLMFIPQIEAHLGKISEEIETGVNYNHEVVEERVRKVFEEAISLQEREQCDRCLVVVGGDFFNSESNGQTSSGTQQQNDVRYKEMFNIGLKLYLEGLLALKEHFNNVDVKICAGNHARAMEHFLYIALSCYFANDDKIKFCEDYKDTQSYVFGNVGLFFNHGDPNQKRLVASIPAEFYEDYGKTKFRYLFLGHLHKLEVINSENGITVHRVPAICENDNWHYQNRFGIGNIPQHEIMVFDKNYGMLNDNFIYFNEPSKGRQKRLIK